MHFSLWSQGAFKVTRDVLIKKYSSIGIVFFNLNALGSILFIMPQGTFNLKKMRFNKQKVLLVKSAFSFKVHLRIKILSILNN